MEGKELHSTTDADGVHVFDVTQLTRVAQELSRRAIDPSKEGSRDSRAFEMLDGGHGLRDLVTTLRISVNVAKGIVSAWSEDGQRDVVVPRPCKVDIEHCLGPFRNAAELVQRVHAAETEHQRVNDELMQLEARQHNLVALIGQLAGRTPALAEVLPEVRERLDGELAQVLDRAFECGTTQLVSAAPRAPDAVGESIAEVPNTMASPAEGEAAAGVAVGSAVELPGAAASTDVVSAPNTSTTKASINDESAGPAAVGESVAAVPRGCDSVGDPVSERRALDGRATASGPDGAAVAATSGTAIGIRVVRSPREQQLDEWLESLAADDARLQRLGALLKREELEMLAELARGIGTEVAATTGSRSPRELLLDRLIASLTEDDARLDKIGAMLTANELDMLAKLGRGLAECETAATMDGEASSQ